MYKKSQFLILSGLFVILLVIFIYSLETDNTYIPILGDSYLLENIEFETCKVLKMSNGTQIENRLDFLSINIPIYCNNRNNQCVFSYQNITTIPPGGNYSLLNYTHFNYSLEINQSSKNINKKIIC